MGLILALIMGGIMGWLASKVMNRDAHMGIFWNVVVGCIGSVLGRFLFGGIFGGSGLRTDPLDPMTLLTAFAGAVVLLVIVNLIQRERAR